MEISAEKTKLMKNNASGINTQTKVCGQKLETALDTLQDSTDNRINDMSISLSSKIRLMLYLVTSIFLYACESWTLTAELQRRIQAMEMRYYHEK